MFEVWVRAVTQPKLATYEALLQEKEEPSLGEALRWVAVGAFVGAMISGVCAQSGYAGTEAFVGLAIGVAVGVVGFLILFLINTAVLLAASKALGGQGNLGSQSYLLAAAAAPMTILISTVSAVPYVGTPLLWAGALYNVFLQVLALRAAHKYGWGSAAVAMVVAILCGVIIGVCALLALQGQIAGLLE